MLLAKEDSYICGIVYSKSFTGRDVTATILKRFEDQRNRGTQSFGFYLPQENRLTHNVKESRIKALLKRTQNEEVLFHHRFATSTINVRNACHPFSTKDVFEYQYVGVHNGVCRNAKELREDHQKLGIEYVSVQENDSFNDSEALIYDLARYFEGHTDAVKASGSIAFIVVKRDKLGNPLTLFFGHNSGNPLKMKRTDHSITVSSEGEGEFVPINVLHMFDYETKELRTSDMYIPLSYQNYYGGGKQNSLGFHRGKGYLPPKTSAITPKVDDVYDSWDDYMDARYERKKIEELQNHMDRDFDMRSGDYDQVREEILENNSYRYESAAITAMMEAKEAEAEKRLWEKFDVAEADEDTATAAISYYMQVGEYQLMLEKIADELHAKAKAEDKKQFGFHSPKVTKAGDNKLSASTVLQNNNK